MIIQILEMRKKESYINSVEQKETLAILSFSKGLFETVHDADLIIDAMVFKHQFFQLLNR
ncbi:hypothetical protein [Metabacillus idriensis]|uniref:hypothetical protein n=1 Tax=Metabacillus idriensis TaxID=324768 RepID=UPI003D2B5204